MIPRATYRLQFHREFGFADAEALVPYLDRLGISHVYASPITVARSGSTHGYDVVDPTRINPELGGEEAFRRLVGTLREHSMGVICDIVPNHMGVAGGENAWWNDVLRHGEASRYARYFDIDWRRRLVLPVLGTPLAQALADGALKVERHDGRAVVTAYGEHRFPVRDEDADHEPGDDPARVEALLERQHYRLAWWRTANDELNWRRFFTISELAALRIEDPEVFDAVHALPLRLVEDGLVDGLRIDHVDGLTDPAGYCRTLRARLDALPRADHPYLVVEKILAEGEPLPAGWGVDGTSGYDFMELASALLHAPGGAASLGALWAEISGRTAAFAPEERQGRQDLLAWQFAGQLEGCVEGFVALAATAPAAAGMTPAMLRRAVERMLWVFPVYRTYGTGDAAPDSDAAVRAEVRERIAPLIPPGEAFVADWLLATLAGEGGGDRALAAEAVRRFQQLSAPIAAKAVEDTAFYRYGRLLSRNDVGFDAARMGIDTAEFHAANAERATRFPHALLATATHDHKRGEDVRARLAVLSELPDAWAAAVREWDGMCAAAGAGIDPADRYMLFQTLVGAWPDALAPDNADGLAAFAERVADWQRKSLREAKLRSSWEAPDEAYEAGGEALIAHILRAADGLALRRSLHAFVGRIAPAARANALVQAALRCLVPGVPDLYQGCELDDLSLVDPDNRRPVDYAARRALLDAAPVGHPKLALIAGLLALRRRHPMLFAQGDYRPVPVSGPRADRVVAFRRRAEGSELLCAVAIRCADGWEAHPGAALPAAWWGDTRLETGEPVAALLAHGPVHASVRELPA